MNDDLVGRDRDETFSPELWRSYASFGVQGLPFPEEYGGGGADVIATVAAMEGLGYGGRDNGLLFAINAQMWSVQMPILSHGSEQLKQRYLPGLIDGSLIGGHCMSEPDSGSDAFSLRTTAEKQGQDYLLNGTKTFVTNGPSADIFLVFATVDQNAGFMGLSAFVVERTTPGLSVTKLAKLGLRTAQMGQVFFDNCVVSSKQMLGPEGAGSSIFNASLEWERAAILGCNVGSMSFQLERCLDFVAEQRRLQSPRSMLSAVERRLTDMKLRLEIARLMIYRVAWLKQTRGRCPSEAAMTKLFVSEAWTQSCLDAIDLFGQSGLLSEVGLERDLRDSMGGLIYSGTSEIQRNIIARLLGFSRT